MADPFRTAQSGLGPRQRDHVRKLGQLADGHPEGVTYSTLARVQGVSTEAMIQALKVPIKKGYVINQSAGKRQAARLVPGEQLPDDDWLPHPKLIAQELGIRRIRSRNDA